jgi:hypothetical protein
MQSLQLDLFADSRDVMLRNDVADALLRRDAPTARAALQRLQAEFAHEPQADALQCLVTQLERGHPAAITSAADACRAADVIEQHIGPAAAAVLGDGSRAWLQPLWRELAQACAGVAFAPEHAPGHAAALWLRAECGREAADAVGRIPSWRRIPAALAWMVQARHRLLGLDAAWPLLAELAWLAPSRFVGLRPLLADPVLERLCKRFAAGYEGGDGDGGDGRDGDADWMWFPAWAAIDQPALVRPLGEAQTQRGDAPERALALVRELIGYEHQGRQRDLIAGRKALRDLNGALFAAYMATR